ncbi:hypothetical protein M885DRAFT_581373 [Pelagophyceae sp. CCMP2097]|nr:hypothetical protein M885DRAFT_581373 [Pelagophyceae sp. CCMP2097]
MARTRPCKVEFEQPGRCSYGLRCSFAHTREECDVSPAELGERAMRLCDNRFSHKTCRHGDDCGFAHNEAESSRRVFRGTRGRS